MWNGMPSSRADLVQSGSLARRTRGPTLSGPEQSTGPLGQDGAPAAMRGRTVVTPGGGCYALPVARGGERSRARRCRGAEVRFDEPPR